MSGYKICLKAAVENPEWEDAAAGQFSGEEINLRQLRKTASLTIKKHTRKQSIIIYKTALETKEQNG
ncbi:hypothetical protein HHL16_06035 [Pseudoflavitalea sp. G-6-1-2]|uniref:hypothetical protein n=1 Tax=Pseudoflavitalea sp. G-6-1-2 TaxID=2728841 RepID=UPI00146BE377|nr:hypothetical protein [Pseudoflavitalea sp. G-6-1-2]NML20423.1 hypothetical protein [Pseudoflavitalea sp. G-6-1-2]